jgi:3-oxoacyl-[acyl-carrier protein] reductase
MGTILKDRVALVTGAVGGIGRAISLHLAQEGAILALNYLLEREQDAEAFLKELTGQG